MVYLVDSEFGIICCSTKTRRWIETSFGAEVSVDLHKLLAERVKAARPIRI